MFGKGSCSVVIVGIKYFDVFQELGYKLFGFGFIVVVCVICCFLCCQICVMGVVGGFWVRENQFYVGMYKIVLVVNIFWVFFVYQEVYCGIEW